MGLVLSRKLNETVVIGDDIRVTYFKREGNQISLRIDAPRDMKVDREEIRLANVRQKDEQPREN